MDKQHHISIWYFLAAFFALLFIENALMGPQAETLPYSQFKDLLKAGKVTEVSVGKEYIYGRLKPEGLATILPKKTVDQLTKLEKSGEKSPRFTTVRVDDPGLVKDLETANIQFSGRVQNTWFTTLLSWVIPALIFVGIWVWFMKKMGAGGMGGMMAIGKSKAKVYLQKQTGVTFEDVAGIDEAKSELMEVVDFLKTPDRYRRLGGKIPKGVLLVGAPGTGKTLLAKAVAGEAGVPFFSMSGSDFVEMFVGLGAARVRDLFHQAQEKAPCIIFIDELDALGKARGTNPMGGHDEREQTLNQLLVEMDGFETNKAVIIVAATNRPEMLDPALLRPGRFDRQVALDRPDLKGREKILRVHTRDVKLASDVDLEVIAARTAGFVGADLANLVNEAALTAARKGKAGVGMDDFDEAADRIVGGLEKKTRVMNRLEKETVAYHESGHALVAESRPHADRVSKISIIPRGIAALGYTQQLPTEDRYLLRRAELFDRIDVLLGGRVAEEIVYGDISTGAQNDLERATSMARMMVTQYGMSEHLGLATFEHARSSFLNVPGYTERNYSERTAQTIDDEVRQILADGHARVRETLTRRRQTLEALAKLLLEKEVVDRAALDQLLAAHPLGVPGDGHAAPEGKPEENEVTGVAGKS
jgi:cell division protease FtsH